MPAAWAQSNDNSVFEVSDVVADVTADSAVHARDQAIAQAQRTAFGQLLDRLGADASLGTKLSNDDIATLVQNFEVQSEHTSSVRYIGTFTVQFRPMAVRDYLGKHNASFDETPGKPVVVLPVLVTNGHATLWEDKTTWRTAWENNAHGGGLVPVIVPTGDLPDVVVISTADAVNGKPESVKAMAEKYNADGVAVVILDTDLDKTGQELKVTIDRYDADGSAQPESKFTLPPPADKVVLNSEIVQAIRQVRQQLEKDWRKEEQTTAPVPTDELPAPVVVDPQKQAALKGPSTHLPVLVMIQTLPQWAEIKHQLESVPAITRVEVVTLQRGSTNIEIEFHGSLGNLQMALAQEGLTLQQDTTNRVWTLQPSPVGVPY